MSEPTAPKAARVLTVQLAFGADRADVDELTELVKAALADLEPKRITMLDAYYLVDGQRTTKAMLTEQAKAPAEPKPARVAPTADSTPVQPARTASKAAAPADIDPDMTDEDRAGLAASRKK